MTAPTRSADGAPRLSLRDVVATLALAQDRAFGQPSGSQLRACALTQLVAVDLGIDRSDAASAYWISLLRFLGCTGHAHEVAVVFGDDIATRARSLRWDPTSAAEPLREAARFGGAGVGRLRAVLAVVAGGRRAAELNFRAGCEVADALASRLGVPDHVRLALAFTFERWNGRGFPAGAQGDAIPLPMRLVQLCQELEVLVRVLGADEGEATVRRRAGRAYDPALVPAVIAAAREHWAELEAADPWDTVLGITPADNVNFGEDAVDAALAVLADFADLKSPFTAGHSRGVAKLAEAAGAGAGLEGADTRLCRRASLVHDLGRVAVSNSVWDKPGVLTRSDIDQVESHPLVTDQLLRRSPFLADLATVASAHHEAADGSGYHRRATNAQLNPVARIIGAADRYHAMTEPRAHRPALAVGDAAVALRSYVKDGRLDADAAEAVLQAAGHRVGRRRTWPAGLTGREVEVLRLLALGLTTRQIANRLVISVKTADHHIQHIYTKAGLSTRGAAALFAIENGLVHPAD